MNKQNSKMIKLIKRLFYVFCRHADVGNLFERTVLGEYKHLPPQGVVLVVPLINMTHAVGPTEFMTGSHVNMV
jgi:hypothetical protein